MAVQPQVVQVEDVVEDSLPAFVTGGNVEPVAAAPAEALRKPRRPRKPREAAVEAAGSEGEASPDDTLVPVEG